MLRQSSTSPRQTPGNKPCWQHPLWYTKLAQAWPPTGDLERRKRLQSTKNEGVKVDVPGIHARPSGTVPRTFFLPSGVSWPPCTLAIIAVSPTAGLIQLYLILSTAYSAASPLVACANPHQQGGRGRGHSQLTTVTPPFELAYQTRLGLGRGSLMELMLMKFPSSFLSLQKGTITLVLR